MAVMRYRKKQAQQAFNRFKTEQAATAGWQAGKTAFIGSRGSVFRASKRVGKLQGKVSVLQAKLLGINANLLRAEASWPIIKEVRKWFWDWRKERIQGKIDAQTARLEKVQEYQTSLTTAYGAKYDTGTLRRQNRVNATKAKLDWALNRVALNLPKMAKIVQAQMDIIQDLNSQRGTGRTTAGRIVPIIAKTKIADMRNKINAELSNPDPRSAAFRLIQTDAELQAVQIQMAQKPRAARTQFERFLANFNNQTSP